MNIEEFLRNDAGKDLLRFSTAGSVDDGKSTLIGRLLHDSKQIYEDQLASVKKASGKINVGLEIDFALVTDGLKAEREQGITIDVAYRYFSTPKRKFIIADTPGHEQYTRNMATGASTANLAIILIDARNGVITQSKRHAFISSLLGIPHMVVAVNKMDIVDYKQEVFEKIKKDFSEFASKLNIRDLHFIPMSALKGDNVVEPSPGNMPWYKGQCLMELLENIYIGSDRNLIDLRFPVQYVTRPTQDFRGYCGRVASGIIRKGDEIMVMPSMKKNKVKSITTFDGELNEAVAGQSVTVTLDKEVDISRGDMLVHPNNLPSCENHFEAMVVWMNEEALDPAKSYYIKHTSNMTSVNIDEIRYKIDVNTMHRLPAESLALNEIGRVVFSSRKKIFFDPYSKNKSVGSFIIIDKISNNTVAAGMILDRLSADRLPKNISRPAEASNYRSYREVSAQEKADRSSQKPVTLWFTGLVSSGKREIAWKLEKALFDKGHSVIVMDASTVRSGISRELEFSQSDRTENIRRAAEISRMLNDNGLISVCAFVSPDASVRKQLSSIIGEERFAEIYVKASLDFCRKRNPAVYEKAEKGEIENFTGISAPYDEPVSPAVTLDMDSISIDEAVSRIVDYMTEKSFIRK